MNEIQGILNMTPPFTPTAHRRQSQTLLRSNTSPPKTPLRKEDDSHSPRVVTGDASPLSTSALRTRRGRRNVSKSSITFRPLSVFTRSIFAPLDLDTDNTFVMIDPEEESTTCTATTDTVLETASTSTICPRSLLASSLQPKDVPEVHPISTKKEPSMNLLEALLNTSPEKDKPGVVNADYETLVHFPPPDVTSHPVFSADPFTSRSLEPLLSTNTPPAEIALSTASPVTSPGGRSLRSLERKRSFFGFDLRTPSSGKSRSAFIEHSPKLSFISPVSAPLSSSFTVSSSPEARDSAATRVSIGSVSSSSGVRKFSDIFKSKSNTDRNTEQVAVTFQETKPCLRKGCNPARSDLESHLRRTTNTPTYDHEFPSSYPRHPCTGRGWKSRNLKCTTCVDECCAVCKRACCAYKAAVVAMENHAEGSASRLLAHQQIQEITRLFPYGKEAPTFLQCTANHTDSPYGCGKLVCPDCCSICPDVACGDTQCRRCKPAMWKECEWHGTGFVLS